MPEGRATSAWRAYLRARFREHGATLLWDLLFAPVVALLMVLPGPNVLGYILLYRILVHVLAIRGVVKARLGGIPVRYEGSVGLDRTIPSDAGAAQPVVESMAREYGLDHLGLFLRRLAGRGSEARGLARASSASAVVSD
jgi:hypothetical protein